MEVAVALSHRLPARFSYGHHSHPYWELILISEGACTVDQESGQRSRVHDVVVVHAPEQEHAVHTHTSCRQDIVGVIGAPADHLCAGVIPADAVLQDVFRRLQHEQIRPGPFQAELLNCLATELVYRVLARQQGDGEDHSRGAAIKRIIERSFHEPLDLGLIADRVYLSRDYVRRLFSREYGVSPIRYLLETRIAHAKTLLRDPQRSIASVASDCGFPDPFYFSRMFKRICGCSPSAWRQHLGDQLPEHR